MRGYYSVATVRAAEQVLFGRVAPGFPMRCAAFGIHCAVADELRRQTGSVAGRRVTLLVGSGDNGGDALFAGAFLAKRGVRVRAILLSPKVHQGGLAAFGRAGGKVTRDLDAPDVVVDGIVGISGSGPLRSEAAELVARNTAPIVAIDVPSGVDPDTGAIAGPHVQAALTVCCGARKPVHALNGAACGRMVDVSIGLELGNPVLATLDPAEVGTLWPVPGPADHKYSTGVTAVCAGSSEYGGAAMLAVGGALRATSGMVRYVGPQVNPVVSRHPEVVASSDFPDGRVDAWVVGPGIGLGRGARNWLARVLAADLPTLVDADGLTLLAREPELSAGRRAPLVLTPHDGEFARMMGAAPSNDRVACAQELAKRFNATVLLKGRATVIAEPGALPLVNDAHGSWAATAGSGDVLSGVIGALLASGIVARTASAMGARAHALAANLAAQGAPILAGDLIAHLSTAIGTLRQHAEAVPRSGRARI